MAKDEEQVSVKNFPNINKNFQEPNQFPPFWKSPQWPTFLDASAFAVDVASPRLQFSVIAWVGEVKFVSLKMRFGRSLNLFLHFLLEARWPPCSDHVHLRARRWFRLWQVTADSESTDRITSISSVRQTLRLSLSVVSAGGKNGDRLTSSPVFLLFIKLALNRWMEG